VGGSVRFGYNHLSAIAWRDYGLLFAAALCRGALWLTVATSGWIGGGTYSCGVVRAEQRSSGISGRRGRWRASRRKIDESVDGGTGAQEGWLPLQPLDLTFMRVADTVLASGATPLSPTRTHRSAGMSASRGDSGVRFLRACRGMALATIQHDIYLGM
jgi:hypothetical protein